MKPLLRLFATIAAVLMLCPALAAEESGPDNWQYSLTPYLWLPTIEGTLKYKLPPGSGGNPGFEIGPTDWLDLLNFGALIGGSARKGRLSISADLVYLSMSNESDGRIVTVEDTISGPGGNEIPVSADVTLNTGTDFDGLMWNLAFGYALQQTDSSFLDVLIGARFFGVDVGTDWNLTAAITTPDGTEVLPASGGVGRNTDLWDVIVGVRGQFRVGDSRWSVPYHADVGTGSSELTWNAMAGLTYAFGWGELMLLYRHLEYDQDSDGLLQGFSFSGPAIGARFKF